MRIRRSHTRNSWGYYLDGNITLSTQLKNHSIPSRQQVEAHERYHLWIDTKSIKLSLRDEEFACFIWEIISTKKRYLSAGDYILQKYIKARFKNITRSSLLSNLNNIKRSLK